MKKILLILSLLLPLFNGCSTQNAVRTAQDANSFPQIMVGVWEVTTSDNSRWGIKFEPDGSIKKIVHMVAGAVRLEDGGVYAEGRFNPEEYMMFEMGPCVATYDTKTKELDVTIVVDYYRIELSTGVLEGKMRDDFSGPISKDGTTWKAKWWDYGWLEGATPPDVNYIKAHPEEIVFHKVEIE
ncbi:MAG: hypothetical protein PHF37_00180 [Phycisphaerae bacterium]|nr:hypothetical protein [Phycisphaerae bacterium]